MLHLSSESIFDVDWNAVWQVIHLYVSGGGCLGQWGFSFLVVALVPAHVTCEQQAPFASLVNGFENGRAGVIVAESHCFTQGRTRAHSMIASHRPLHRTGGMRCFSPFCIGIAVCWWAVVHNDTAAHAFVVLVSLCCWS
jgi:hypothetical protein